MVRDLLSVKLHTGDEAIPEHGLIDVMMSQALPRQVWMAFHQCDKQEDSVFIEFTEAVVSVAYVLVVALDKDG